MTMAMAVAGAAWGQAGTNPLQAPAAAAPAAASFFSQVTDPVTISAGAYVLSQVASGATDWKFTLAGKSYNVSAAQKTGITAASVIGAAAIAHKWPKWKTPLAGVLTLAAAYYGGKAYANSLNHGSAATATSTAAAAKFRMGR
jgi:hypothetical protein